MPVVNPRVPEGLRDLMKGLTKEVLREKPPNIYEFSANYFETLLQENKDFIVKEYEPAISYENLFQAKERNQIPVALVFKIIPEGLTELIKEFIKAVLRENPKNLCEFAVNYFRHIQNVGSVKNGTIQYTAYENYFSSKERFVFTPYVKCTCGRTFGEGLTQEKEKKINTNKFSKKDIQNGNGRNLMQKSLTKVSAISAINLDSSLQNDADNQKNGHNAPPTVANLHSTAAKEITNVYDERYVTAIFIIQRFLRRCLRKQKLKAAEGQSEIAQNGTSSEQSTQMTEEAAAIIIQRSVRKLFTAKFDKNDKDIPIVPQLENIQHLEEHNDNVSEAASYTSASTVQMSAESAGETTEREIQEIGSIVSEEQAVIHTIEEGVEQQNDSAAEPIKIADKITNSIEDKLNKVVDKIAPPLIIGQNESQMGYSDKMETVNGNDEEKTGSSTPHADSKRNSLQLELQQIQEANILNLKEADDSHQRLDHAESTENGKTKSFDETTMQNDKEKAENISNTENNENTLKELLIEQNVTDENDSEVNSKIHQSDIDECQEGSKMEPSQSNESVDNFCNNEDVKNEDHISEETESHNRESIEEVAESELIETPSGNMKTTVDNEEIKQSLNDIALENIQTEKAMELEVESLEGIERIAISADSFPNEDNKAETQTATKDDRDTSIEALAGVVKERFFSDQNMHTDGIASKELTAVESNDDNPDIEKAATIEKSVEVTAEIPKSSDEQTVETVNKKVDDMHTNLEDLPTTVEITVVVKENEDITEISNEDHIAADISSKLQSSAESSTVADKINEINTEVIPEKPFSEENAITKSKDLEEVNEKDDNNSIRNSFEEKNKDKEKRNSGETIEENNKNDDTITTVEIMEFEEKPFISSNDKKSDEIETDIEPNNYNTLENAEIESKVNLIKITETDEHNEDLINHERQQTDLVIENSVDKTARHQEADSNLNDVDEPKGVNTLEIEKQELGNVEIISAEESEKSQNLENSDNVEKSDENIEVNNMKTADQIKLEKETILFNEQTHNEDKENKTEITTDITEEVQESPNNDEVENQLEKLKSEDLSAKESIEENDTAVTDDNQAQINLPESRKAETSSIEAIASARASIDNSIEKSELDNTIIPTEEIEKDITCVEKNNEEGKIRVRRSISTDDLIPEDELINEKQSNNQNDIKDLENFGVMESVGRNNQSPITVLESTEEKISEKSDNTGNSEESDINEKQDGEAIETSNIKESLKETADSAEIATNDEALHPMKAMSTNKSQNSSNELLDEHKPKAFEVEMKASHESDNLKSDENPVKVNELISNQSENDVDVQEMDLSVGNNISNQNQKDVNANTETTISEPKDSNENSTTQRKNNESKETDENGAAEAQVMAKNSTDLSEEHENEVKILDDIPGDSVIKTEANPKSESMDGDTIQPHDQPDPQNVLKTLVEHKSENDEELDDVTEYDTSTATPISFLIGTQNSHESKIENDCSNSEHSEPSKQVNVGKSKIIDNLNNSKTTKKSFITGRQHEPLYAEIHLKSFNRSNILDNTTLKETQQHENALSSTDITNSVADSIAPEPDAPESDMHTGETDANAEHGTAIRPQEKERTATYLYGIHTPRNTPTLGRKNVQKTAMTFTIPMEGNSARNLAEIKQVNNQRDEQDLKDDLEPNNERTIEGQIIVNQSENDLSSENLPAQVKELNKDLYENDFSAESEIELESPTKLFAELNKIDNLEMDATITAEEAELLKIKNQNYESQPTVCTTETAVTTSDNMLKTIQETKISTDHVVENINKKDMSNTLSETFDPLEFGSNSDNESDITSSWTCSKETDENVFSDEFVSEYTNEDEQYRRRRSSIILNGNDEIKGGIYEVDPTNNTLINDDTEEQEKEENSLKDISGSKQSLESKKSCEEMEPLLENEKSMSTLESSIINKEAFEGDQIEDSLELIDKTNTTNNDNANRVKHNSTESEKNQILEKDITEPISDENNENSTNNNNKDEYQEQTFVKSRLSQESLQLSDRTLIKAEEQANEAKPLPEHKQKVLSTKALCNTNQSLDTKSDNGITVEEQSLNNLSNVESQNKSKQHIREELAYDMIPNIHGDSVDSVILNTELKELEKVEPNALVDNQLNKEDIINIEIKNIIDTNKLDATFIKKMSNDSNENSALEVAHTLSTATDQPLENLIDNINYDSLSNRQTIMDYHQSKDLKNNNDEQLSEGSQELLDITYTKSKPSLESTELSDFKIVNKISKEEDTPLLEINQNQLRTEVIKNENQNLDTEFSKNIENKPAVNKEIVNKIVTNKLDATFTINVTPTDDSITFDKTSNSSKEKTSLVAPADQTDDINNNSSSNVETKIDFRRPEDLKEKNDEKHLESNADQSDGTELSEKIRLKDNMNLKNELDLSKNNFEKSQQEEPHTETNPVLEGQLVEKSLGSSTTQSLGERNLNETFNINTSEPTAQRFTQFWEQVNRVPNLKDEANNSINEMNTVTSFENPETNNEIIKTESPKLKMSHVTDTNLEIEEENNNNVSRTIEEHQLNVNNSARNNRILEKEIEKTEIISIDNEEKSDKNTYKEGSTNVLNTTYIKDTSKNNEAETLEKDDKDDSSANDIKLEEALVPKNHSELQAPVNSISNNINTNTEVTNEIFKEQHIQNLEGSNSPKGLTDLNVLLTDISENLEKTAKSLDETFVTSSNEDLQFVEQTITELKADAIKLTELEELIALAPSPPTSEPTDEQSDKLKISNKDAAATTIQKHYKGYRVRQLNYKNNKSKEGEQNTKQIMIEKEKKVLDQAKAAFIIQNAFKKYKSKSLKNPTIIENSNKFVNAALTIQRAFRNYKANKLSDAKQNDVPKTLHTIGSEDNTAENSLDESQITEIYIDKDQLELNAAKSEASLNVTTSPLSDNQFENHESEHSSNKCSKDSITPTAPPIEHANDMQEEAIYKVNWFVGEDLIVRSAPGMNITDALVTDNTPLVLETNHSTTNDACKTNIDFNSTVETAKTSSVTKLVDSTSSLFEPDNQLLSNISTLKTSDEIVSAAAENSNVPQEIVSTDAADVNEQSHYGEKHPQDKAEVNHVDVSATGKSPETMALQKEKVKENISSEDEEAKSDASEQKEENLIKKQLSAENNKEDSSSSTDKTNEVQKNGEKNSKEEKEKSSSLDGLNLEKSKSDESLDNVNTTKQKQELENLAAIVDEMNDFIATEQNSDQSDHTENPTINKSENTHTSDDTPSLAQFIDLERKHWESDIPYTKLEETCTKKTISLLEPLEEDATQQADDQRVSSTLSEQPTSDLDLEIERSSNDSLESMTKKLHDADVAIEKMQLRRASTARSNSNDEVKIAHEVSFDEPVIKSMQELQENRSSELEDEEAAIVLNRLQHEDTRESSAQSDSVVYGENDNKTDKKFEYKFEDSPILKISLQRNHTIAGDDAKSLFKSVTIDDTVQYIEPPDCDTTATSGSSFCLDDDVSENIRKKMMAYSLSEADSDYFDNDGGDATARAGKQKLHNDDFNISTALVDLAGTSTETESTIVSAATKIQAGARGFLTRKRLRRTSGGTKSTIPDNSLASFGNDAISESLERLIEEEAAKKIQHAYRRHYRQKDLKPPVIEVHSDDEDEWQKTNANDEEDAHVLLSFESTLAARRLTLQRGDALRNDSTPDEETGTSSSNGKSPTNTSNESGKVLNEENENNTEQSNEKSSSSLSGDSNSMYTNQDSEESEVSKSSGDKQIVESEQNTKEPTLNEKDIKLMDALDKSSTSALTADAASNKKKIDSELKWIGLRQNSMPVQIETEVFRVIPKHMRKRIKSAESPKKRRLRVLRD